MIITFIQDPSQHKQFNLYGRFKVIPPLLLNEADLCIDIEYGYGYPFTGFEVDIKKDNGTVFYSRGDYVN